MKKCPRNERPVEPRRLCIQPLDLALVRECVLSRLDQVRVDLGQLRDMRAAGKMSFLTETDEKEMLLHQENRLAQLAEEFQ